MLGYFTAEEYTPRLDIKADFVSIRGGNVKKRVQLFKKAGYKKILYGTSTGHDAFYTIGKWDGKKHYEEIQLSKYPGIVWEGTMLNWYKVPIGNYVAITFPPFRFGSYYIVPTRNYIEYKREEIKKAFEAGVVGLEFDEPEFWHRAGYSEAFKKAWEEFYGERWVDPESSYEARYKAEKLKAYLYLRLAEEIFSFVKKLNPQAECILNPHSPINYAEMFQARSPWGGITAPIALSLQIKALDSILGEVWSDTIKANFMYGGYTWIDPFFHSYLERSYFENLVYNSNKKLYHLLDPKSDDPKFDWYTYRRWFEQDTLAAFMVGATNFIVAWPERLLTTFMPPAYEPPEDYVSIFLSIMSVCRDIQNYPLQERSKIGIPISDTIMWTRGRPGLHYIDGFYALALPLPKEGIPIEIFPIERSVEKSYLDRFKVIVMSYEEWIPQNKEYHDSIVRWVRSGGVLIYFGETLFYDLDEFWRKEGYLTPQDHLIAALGVLKRPVMHKIPYTTTEANKNNHELVTLLGKKIDLFKGELIERYVEKPYLLGYEVPEDMCLYKPHGKDNISVIFEKRIGKGMFIYVGYPPRFLAYSTKGPNFVRSIIKYAASKVGMKLEEKESLAVKRGPYLFIYALKDTTIEGGPYIDILDPDLSIIRRKKLSRGEYSILKELKLPKTLDILFSSSRVKSKHICGNTFIVEVEGPESTRGVTLLYLQNHGMKSVKISDKKGINHPATISFYREFNILKIKYIHSKDPLKIEIKLI